MSMCSLSPQIKIHAHSPAIGFMVTSKNDNVQYYCYIAGNILVSMGCTIIHILMHVHPPGGVLDLVVTNNVCFVVDHKSSPVSI